MWRWLLTLEAVFGIACLLWIVAEVVDWVGDLWIASRTLVATRRQYWGE